jgi:hypothetical protein
VSHTLKLKVPSVPFGPLGVPAEKADADYYRAAARNIRYGQEQGRSFAGSNLTETVAKLCDAVAEALDRQPQPIDTPDELHPLTPGRRVTDSSGDIWEKQRNGEWLLLYNGDDFTLSAEHLVHTWSPLHTLPEEN